LDPVAGAEIGEAVLVGPSAGILAGWSTSTTAGAQTKAALPRSMGW